MNPLIGQKLFNEILWVLPSLCLQAVCLFLAVKGLAVRRKAAVLTICSFSLFMANTVLAPFYFTWRGRIFTEMYSKNVFGLTPQLFIYTSFRAVLSLGAWLLLVLAFRELFKRPNQGNLAT